MTEWDGRRPNDDELAADYARYRRIHPGVLTALIETGRVTKLTRVLEVGCGTGNYLRAMGAAAGCAAVGLDPSPAMIRAARARPIGGDLVRCRAEALPVADRSCDLIFSVDVIHHVGDRGAYFREAWRALREGGRICTATDSEEDIARRRPLTSHFPETVPLERARYPTIATLKAELTDAGFRRVWTEHVELVYALTDLEPYRSRAFSSLHLIDGEAWARGLARLAEDLRAGPIAALSLYTLVWGER